MTSIPLERSAERHAVQGAEISAYTVSFGISLGLTSVLNAALVIIKETNEHTVLVWMKATGNHWIAHGVLDIVVFVVLGFLLAHTAGTWRSHPNRVAAAAISGVILGALAIAGFYIRAT